MTPERWRQIEELYYAALERDASQWAAFLEHACGGDEALRREVESLMASHEQAGSFIKAPAIEVAAELMAEDQTRLAMGKMIGPYKIVARLGAGGMGEVYLAEDTRLGRKVALKLLPDYLTKEKERVQRFRQEARAASALSHANAATIYEIGEAEGTIYIAMEYVEGQTLDAKLNGRPLETGEILDIAAQVADALEEAHAKGITHRDIKPGNIMLTPRGQVKILDFGLAKMTRREEQMLGSDISTQMKTEPGLVMGTVAYMSPEQALGKEVDHRTDTFSLGVVLYEMATGQRPFSGTTTGETLDQIIHAEPEAIGRFNSNAPAELERIIRQCLEKEPDRRYQSAQELVIDLRNLKRAIESGVAKKVAPEWWRHWRRVALAALALVILAVMSVGLYLLAGRGKTIDSIAVLPFANASADPNMEYLSDGIPESLINSLSQLPNLKVMSRSSVFRYKGRETDAQVVGRELSVRAVLTGEVVQRGDDLTIRIELVDARDNSHIWGEQYNRKLADALAIQEEMAKEISDKLRLKLSGEEQKRLAKRYTENAEAYQLYLKGNYYASKATEDGLRKGIEYFHQAIAIDPNYALAYNGLAFYYMLAADWLLSPNESMPKAKEAAQRALAIDETLAEAHASLAEVAYRYDWDWAAAEREFKRAIELNPNDAITREYYSCYLFDMGRTDQAIAAAKRGQQLDPISLEVNAYLGAILLFAHQYDQAIEQLRKTIDLDPSYWPAHDFLGRAYEQKGELELATAEFQRAIQIEDAIAENWANLGHAYALSGKRGEAQKIIGHLKELSVRSYVPPYNMAAVYAGLGDKDQAFAWLNRAYAERSYYMSWLKGDPQLDDLRSDPRFADLLRRIGLAP